MKHKYKIDLLIETKIMFALSPDVMLRFKIKVNAMQLNFNTVVINNLQFNN